MSIYFEDQRFKLFSPNARHAFFGRQGGVSQGLYDSLNCGAGSHDNPEYVKTNKDIVKSSLHARERNLVTLHQIHSVTCVIADNKFDISSHMEADAFVSDRTDILLGILTADCVPVLFYAEKKSGGGVIGAAHAGWKGALGGILEETVRCLQKFDINKNTLTAVIGPAIGPESYEVDEEFKQKFEGVSAENSRYFIKKSADKFLCDLPQFCMDQLKKAGVIHVFNKNLDTFFNEEDFYSYRRATHRRDKDYGRQISVIGLWEKA